jgi:hypothetical protein
MQHRVRRKLCPSERSSGILRIETDQRELPVCRDDPQGRGPTMSPCVGRRSWSVPCNPEPIPTRRRRRQTPRVGGTGPPQYGHPDQEFHQLGVMEAWSQLPHGRLTGRAGAATLHQRRSRSPRTQQSERRGGAGHPNMSAPMHSPSMPATDQGYTKITDIPLREDDRPSA